MSILPKLKATWNQMNLKLYTLQIEKKLVKATRKKEIGSTP